MLLKSGADPNIQCIDGRTALTGTTANNHFDTVELLLCYKANPHILFSPIGGEEGGTDSFGIAAARSHIESLKIFLKHTDLHLNNISRGWSLACYLGQIPIIRLLSNRLYRYCF